MIAADIMISKQQHTKQSPGNSKVTVNLHGSSRTLEEAYGLAVTETNLGNFQAALDIYALITAKIPNFADFHNAQALLLLKMKKYKEALASFDKTITLKPDFLEAHINRGLILQQMGQHDEALASYAKAIALKPNYAQIYFNRGLTFQELGQHEKALTDYSKAIALKPDYATAYNNRGIVLQEMKHYAKALESFDKAIALNSLYAEAYNNRGFTFYCLGRYDNALANYDKAIATSPHYSEAYWNKGNIKLLLGEYEEGWPLYEWRWKRQGKPHARIFREPLWLGKENLSGKTILIHAEQGLGDTIQLCRYVPILEKLGATILLEVQKSLVPLLAALKGANRVLAYGDALPEFDFHCPTMSLPLALQTSLNTIPSTIPYLFPNQENLKIWKAHLGEKSRPRIGLSWSGSISHTNDSNRSMPLTMLAPILCDAFEFHCIQKDLRPRNQEFMEHSRITSHTAELHSFLDTASLISEMDLIISVDTSAAHLAGALGKKLWLLLPFAPDFRWLDARKDSPWYPSACLFRQPDIDDWNSVIAKVNAELETLASCRKAQNGL